MLQYFLMHKDQKCGILTIDEQSGKIIKYHSNGNGISPYLGNSRKGKQYHCMKKEENNQNLEVSKLLDSFWLKQIRIRNNYNIKAIPKHQY